MRPPLSPSVHLCLSVPRHPLAPKTFAGPPPAPGDPAGSTPPKAGSPPLECFVRCEVPGPVVPAPAELLRLRGGRRACRRGEQVRRPLRPTGAAPRRQETAGTRAQPGTCPRWPGGQPPVSAVGAWVTSSPHPHRWSAGGCGRGPSPCPALTPVLPPPRPRGPRSPLVPEESVRAGQVPPPRHQV